ncbi:MAG: HDOD domain-containing protein [Ignavibacteriales bacterium]|nr:MAG: metal dependent phosphohydrolase [Stygiobacter sp.]KAF0216430.1 MAG: metal dependent [Ignavibacteria bacterium]MBI3124866.1 HDOD domain-containing protein [Ignavibacteriales bacterium]
MDISEKIRTSVNNLPTLPTIYTQLSLAIEDPLATNEKIAKIISSDQTSAFKVLKVANSPLYGLHGKIDSISQALMYLGHNEVKNIVFSLSVMKMFSKDKNVRGLRPVDLWAHSIGVGVITRNIGLAIGEKNVENYFLAGVFHDIGKIIFLEFAVKEYQKVMELVVEKKCQIKDAEKEVFGIDHASAGQILADKWRIPQNIQEIIYNHHMEQKAKETNTMLASVHLGNIVAHILGFGFSGDNLIPQPNPIIWDALKLRRGTILSLKDKFIDDYSHTIKMMLM